MALIPTKKIDNFKNQTIDTITDNVILISNNYNRLINAKSRF